MTASVGFGARTPTLGQLLPVGAFPALGVLQAAGLLFLAFAGALGYGGRRMLGRRTG